MKENFYKKIEEIFSKNKISLTDIQKEKFYNYYRKNMLYNVE